MVERKLGEAESFVSLERTFKTLTFSVADIVELIQTKKYQDKKNRGGILSVFAESLFND